MPASDGNIDIKITGSVDPSVAASANAATASFAGLNTVQQGLAKSVLAGEMSLAQLSAALGKSADAQATMAAVTKAVEAAKVADAAATGVETVAVEANTKATINNRAAYEATVLVHEALQGRFSRMTSSSMILAQQLGGQALTTNIVTFATSGLGLAILGTVAALALFTAATISHDEEEKRLTDTVVGLGAASGLTAEQLKAIGESANASSQSVRETTKAAEAFAAENLHDAATVQILSNSVYAYSQLTGTKFAEAQKQLAAAMKDPVKGAKDLHDQLGILDGDQIEQIQRLAALGEKDQAVAIITQALAHRIDEAKQAGVGLRGEFGSLIDVLSNVYNSIGNVSEAFGKEAETILERLVPAIHQVAQAHRDAAAAAQNQVQHEAQLDDASAKGAALYDKTPEGEVAARRNELIGDMNKLGHALDADTEKYGANSEAVKRDKIALEDYNHALNTLMTPLEKKIKADQLQEQINIARHAHNKQLVADLTEQKSLIEQSGIVESEAQAKALAAATGDVAGSRVFPKGGGKGPSIVSEWQEQLHEAEILSNDFFNDQTQNELNFWQGKLALTKVGSKEWLDVQSKIYDASKTLAHKDYDEHIADLNDRLEADRNDFGKFKADWDEKLAFIKSKFKEESTQYKDAHRQMVADEKQFQERMLQEELSGNNKQIQSLKQVLAAEQQVRQETARLAVSEIQANKTGDPFSQIAGIKEIAQIHHQMALQEMADAQRVYNEENSLRQKGLADTEKMVLSQITDEQKYVQAKAALERGDYALATSLGAQDVQKYKDALNQKLTTDKLYYAQKQQMELKDKQQQLQDLQTLKAAYHQYIDGTVQSMVSGFANMADGTGTFRDAVIGVYNSIKSAVEQIISQIIENWIVNLIVGQGQTAATNEASALSYVGLAGAAGVASFAGAPWPIDMGAPAFGSAMASAAAGYAALAGLDTGTNYLPADRIAQLHEGERVLPKADNRKLIEILNATVNAGQGPSIHLHSSPTFNGNQASLWDHMVKNHEREMIRFFNRKIKNNGLRFNSEAA